MNEKIENIADDIEVPTLNELDMFMRDNIDVSSLKVNEAKTPKLDIQKGIRHSNIEKKELTKKEEAIMSISFKYSVDEEEIKRKLLRYKKFSTKKDSLSSKNDTNFIKKAILEKKSNDENNLIDEISNSIAKGVIKDIREDRMLEPINKKTIYKRKHLEDATQEIKQCIDAWSIAIKGEDIESLAKIENSEVFNTFLKSFNVIHLDSDILSFQKLFYGKDGEINFIKMISMFFGNEIENNKIKQLAKEAEKLNLRMSDVFSL